MRKRIFVISFLLVASFAMYAQDRSVKSSASIKYSDQSQTSQYIRWALTEYELESSKECDRLVPPDKVMDAIGLKPGMIIGEAGAGNGYFTFKLRSRIGNKGAIYANDILSGEDIENRCRRVGIENIYTVFGKVDDAVFPRDDLEIVVIALCFHDFTEPVRWLKKLKEILTTKCYSCCN